jgi:acetyltransferase-like isoleucine patch superfamily enzyme
VQDHAFFGFNVCVLTGTHEYTLLDPRRQDAILTAVNNIVIEEGAWIATNVTIIGPARIGAWSVVASGALVRADVPPRTIVAGVPAKVVRSLDESPNVQGLAQNIQRS